jgi:hypothetical protein
MCAVYIMRLIGLRGSYYSDMFIIYKEQDAILKNKKNTSYLNYLM